MEEQRRKPGRPSPDLLLWASGQRGRLPVSGIGSGSNRAGTEPCDRLALQQVTKSVRLAHCLRCFYKKVGLCQGPNAPIPSSQSILFCCGLIPVKVAPFFGAPRETLTGISPQRTIADTGNGSEPSLRRVDRLSGSGCRSPSATLRLAHCLCLSPCFYSQLFGPAGPLPDGVPRIGGALLSPARSVIDHSAERSQPHSDGCAEPLCHTGSHSKLSRNVYRVWLSPFMP